MHSWWFLRGYYVRLRVSVQQVYSVSLTVLVCPPPKVTFLSSTCPHRRCCRASESLGALWNFKTNRRRKLTERAELVAGAPLGREGDYGGLRPSYPPLFLPSAPSLACYESSKQEKFKNLYKDGDVLTWLTVMIFFSQPSQVFLYRVNLVWLVSNRLCHCLFSCVVWESSYIPGVCLVSERWL